MSALARTRRDDLLDAYGEHDVKAHGVSVDLDEEAFDDEAREDAAWRAELAEAGWTPDSYAEFLAKSKAPSACQVITANRRAERRFDAEATPITGLGAFDALPRRGHA